eukprot:scaffold26024_cov112-Isochrysis_galbana.AAC.2
MHRRTAPSAAMLRPAVPLTEKMTLYKTTPYAPRCCFLALSICLKTPCRCCCCCALVAAARLTSA